jgi:hypothetical protein
MLGERERERFHIYDHLQFMIMIIIIIWFRFLTVIVSFLSNAFNVGVSDVLPTVLIAMHITTR